MKRMTRRRALLGGSATVLALCRPAQALVSKDGVDSRGMPNLVAEIIFNEGSPVGGPVIFDVASGIDIGNYTAPSAGFTQRCIRVRNGSLPNFFVDFRPDVDSGRIEAVFWNGEVDPVNSKVASGYKRDLPSYTVTIKSSGLKIFSARIPYHYWATRWRYQSADRPVIRKAEQVLGNFFPNMSLSAARLSGNDQTIRPSLSRNGARSFNNKYTPFMPPDTISLGGRPMPSTTLVSVAKAGTTTIAVASSAGFSTSDHVAVLLSDGTTFATRVRNIAGTAWTLEFGLPNSASSGATIYRGEYKLGLYLYIETGGERAELGAMTEWAADYLLNGNENSLNAIRQHAEMASGEWPFFLPDLNTNSALNFKKDLKRYKTYIDSASYGSYYWAAYTNLSNGWDFHEQDSHFQMHPYIAFALTEDSYFLEGVQYIQAYGVGNRATMYRREGNPTSGHGNYGFGDLLGTPNGSGGTNGPFTNCSQTNEIRTVGNGIRNLAMAYKVSPAKPPAWVLPQGYFASLSSDYSSVVNTLWTTSHANLHSIFRQLSQDSYFQVFEQAYGLMGMAIADLVGMTTGSNPSWLSQLTFYFGMIDAVTNGTSGWNRQTPQPHNIKNDTSGGSACTAAVCNLDFSLFSNWGDLYKAVQPFIQNGAKFPNAGSPGNQQGGSMGNCNMIYAAAAMAKSRGVPAAASAKEWMDTFIDYNYPKMGLSMEMKCAFDGT